MIKKITGFIGLLIFFSISAHAQIEKPVKWMFSATKLSDKLYEIHMTATIDDKWHLYAQDAGKGPEPTAITFTSNPLVKMDGKVKEVGKAEKNYDPNFKSTIKYYTQKVDFVQKVKLRSAAATELKGNVSFMACNDKRCIPPADVPFAVKLGGK